MATNNVAQLKIEAPPKLGEIGNNGLKRFSGYVDDEFHRDLRGSKAIKVYREMRENHPLINATFLIIDALARHVKYWVDEAPEDLRPEASKDDPRYAAAKDLISQAFEDLDGGIESCVVNALSFAPYGFAVLEKVFKIRRGDSDDPWFRSRYNDGKWGWRKLRPTAQDTVTRWEFDRNGDVLGVYQSSAPTFAEVFIPREKFVHIRLNRDRGNPEGRSLLRGAYVPYYYQKQMQFIEAVGIERNVAGLPKFELPPEIMSPTASSDYQAIRRTYESMGRNLRMDELACVVMPSSTGRDGQPTGYKFELISSSGRTFADTDPVIKRYRQEVAMALLAEHIVVGMDKAGSFSLHADKTDMFALGVAGLIDSVLDELQRDAVVELCVLNGIPAQFAPVLKHGDLESQSLAELGQYVATIVGAGAVVPDQKLEDHLREAANLPARDEATAIEPAEIAAPTGST